MPTYKFLFFFFNSFFLLGATLFIFSAPRSLHHLTHGRAQLVGSLTANQTPAGGRRSALPLFLSLSTPLLSGARILDGLEDFFFSAVFSDARVAGSPSELARPPPSIATGGACEKRVNEPVSQAQGCMAHPCTLCPCSSGRYGNPFRYHRHTPRVVCRYKAPVPPSLIFPFFSCSIIPLSLSHNHTKASRFFTPNT